MAVLQVQDGAVDADGLSEAGQGARNARQNTLASFPALGPPDLVYTVKRYRGLVGAPTYAVRFFAGICGSGNGGGLECFSASAKTLWCGVFMTGEMGGGLLGPICIFFSVRLMICRGSARDLFAAGHC